MTKQEIIDIIDSGTRGYYTGTRLIFPFKCHFIKIIADSHIITQFKKNRDITISQEPTNTSIYFTEVGSLKEFEDGYQTIKVVLCSWHDDLSNPDNHVKLICNIEDNHKVDFEIPGDDVLFIV